MKRYWLYICILLFGKIVSSSICAPPKAPLIRQFAKRDEEPLTIDGRSCTSHLQCNNTEKKRKGISDIGKKTTNLGDYACIDGKCRYVVKAGEVCISAGDCAAYHLHRDWVASNNSSGIDENQTWCGPGYCTLESTCDGAWTQPGAPEMVPIGAMSQRLTTNGTISCCRGFLAGSQCSLYRDTIDTCGNGLNCRIPKNATGGTCTTQQPKYQIWIGVVLVLLGGATLNIGLNVQKYAFRKRQQCQQTDNRPAATETADAQADIASAESVSSPVILDKYYSQSVPHIGSHLHDNIWTRGKHTTPSTAYGTKSLVMERSKDSRHYIQLTESDHSSSISSQAAPKWHQRLRTQVGKTAFASPMWVTGLFVFIVGNVVNFIALQFAPQSLVAPLGAVALVTNVVVAPLLNNEKIGLYDIGGIVLIIVGCVVVVVFSGIVQQDYRLCVLMQLLRARATVIYLCLIAVAILSVYMFLWAVERAVAKYNSSGTDDSAPQDRKWFQRLRFYHPLLALDRFISPINPAASRRVKYGLPLAYASLGSLMASLTTLFAKSLANLLVVTVFNGDNQFDNVLAWAILAITVFTAVSQVYWINQGLIRYDALLQVPVFYVVWTVLDIVGGGVYFNEFREFTTTKYVLFAVGVAIIFAGVGLLSRRMRSSP